MSKVVFINWSVGWAFESNNSSCKKKFGAKSLSDDKKDISVELATVNLQKQVLLTKTTFL
jgi:hypothetical protein